MPDEVVATPVVNAAAVKPEGQPAAEVKAPVEDERITKLTKQIKEASRISILASQKVKAAEAERAKMAAERDEHARWRKERETEDADHLRNMPKWMEKKFGPNWKDVAAQVALTDAPTPGMLASEMDERETKLRKEFEETTSKFRKELEEKETQKAQAEAQKFREDYAANARAHIESNKEKYPLTNAAKQSWQVGQVIQSHFESTMGQDENGDPTPGEVLTADQAADKMEKHLADLAEVLIKAKTPAASSDDKPAATVVPRRTLSANLPSRAAPPNWTPPKDEAERRARALAAMTMK